MAGFRSLQDSHPPPNRARRMNRILTMACQMILFCCCCASSGHGDWGSHCVPHRFVSGRGRGSFRVSVHDWGGDAWLLARPLRHRDMSVPEAGLKGSRAKKRAHPVSHQQMYSRRHAWQCSQRAHWRCTHCGSGREARKRSP